MTVYLADTSAWHRSLNPEVASLWQTRLGEDWLGTCTQVRLEILYSAQSRKDYDRLAAELMALRQLPCGSEEFERALDVQKRLAARAALHHRSVKIADLMIAASAEAGGAVVWHYDQDFDRIASVTGQPTEWVAPRGSL
ncbi:MAG: PIN domain nuclease [Acidimicrobiia bacterium]